MIYCLVLTIVISSDTLQRMKKYVATLGILCSAGAAQALDCAYQLPESGLLPSAASLTIWSDVSERHGKASSLGLQEYNLVIPFSDPRRTHFGKWAFNAELDMSLTTIHTSGSLEMHHDELYSASLPLTVLRSLPEGRRVSMTLIANYATDLSAQWDGLDVGGAAMYRMKYTDTFSFSAGLLVMPQRLEYGLAPYFKAEWKPTQDWNITLKGYNLEALYSITPRLAAGPFIMGEGNTWAVRTRRGTELFSVRSLVAGVTAEYDFSEAGQTNRIVKAQLGSTLATTARFQRLDSGKHTNELHHYHPGFYASVAVDFRF